jgi:hypothetical protein
LKRCMANRLPARRWRPCATRVRSRRGRCGWHPERLRREAFENHGRGRRGRPGCGALAGLARRCAHKRAWVIGPPPAKQPNRLQFTVASRWDSSQPESWIPGGTAKRRERRERLNSSFRVAVSRLLGERKAKGTQSRGPKTTRFSPQHCLLATATGVWIVGPTWGRSARAGLCSRHPPPRSPHRSVYAAAEPPPLLWWSC